MKTSLLAGFRPALPGIFAPERLALGLESWLARAKDESDAPWAPFVAALADDEDGRALLAAFFCHSPFLAQLLLERPALLQDAIEQGPDRALKGILDALDAEAGAELETGRLMAALRRARKAVALTVAFADLAGIWSVEQVTAALSAFADHAVQLAASHLLRRAQQMGELALPRPEDPTRGSGLVIIGMGKLGARELNYSSDIDLILLYERERIDYRGRRTLEDCFVRIARDLVRLLQERTADGYVFRTDLRLRPDPSSTPLALSVIAAEAYYESVGQNWERAAMIKARAIAGDIEAGEKFLQHLRPFVWRKHLDFAAIQDIHSIKRQIHAVKGHRDIAVAGHNIKLGRGGIREIEFFAQTQQLIWGGREPALRDRTTCGAIRALVAADRVTQATAADMIGAYRYLRTLEHRLQMIDDRQTQTLPAEGPELDQLAAFMGAADRDSFGRELLDHLGRVEDHYAELFEEAPSLGGPGSLVFTGTENDPETVRTLSEMGFRDGGSISGVIRTWHTGRYRATRSVRARELLTELMPHLLGALGKTLEPDAAFARFDAFLSKLPAGVQLFSLLQANPGLLELLAEIMGLAPRLADRLSQRPALLDAVLTQRFFEAVPPIGALKLELAAALAEARDFQDHLDLTRSWAKDRQFQIGLGVLRNQLDGEAAGGPFSDLAEACIAGLMPAVEGAFVEQHGRLPGRGLAVVALGKLGSREMAVTSDLDLIFLYDLPTAMEANPPLSDGRKPLAPIQYYARLAQRLIAALSVATAEGTLYEVDMRLRPSGNSGPIASSLESFRRYQTEEAWSFEHMALTRARVIAGDPAFGAEIAASLTTLLTRPRDFEKLGHDVADMRRRMAQTHPTDRFWDLKHRQGGLIDIEFVAQYLQLRHAADRPQILRHETGAALAAATAAGFLEGGAEAALQQALHLWRRLQGLIRLTVGSDFDEAQLPDALRAALAKAGGAVDFASLKANIERSAAAARAVYEDVFAGFAAGEENR